MTIEPKFTLSSYAGSLVIIEPGGWDRAALKLERNKEFASLVEFYDQPFLFHSDGYAYIKAAENEKGPDVQITLTLEVSSDDGDTYETLFVGLLDLSTKKEVDFYKLECGLLRNDFWQKFINRRTLNVDLSDTSTLSGGTVSLQSSVTASLPSQKIRKIYSGKLSEAIVYRDGIAASDYIQLDMDDEAVSEITEKYSLPSIENPTVPGGLFIVDEDGTYVFDLLIEVSQITHSGSCTPPAGPTSVSRVIDSTEALLDFYIKINDGTPVAFTEANSPLVYLYRSTKYSYSATRTLKKGDEIIIYGDMLGALTDFDQNLWIHGEINEGEIDILGGYALPSCAPIYGTENINIAPPSGNAIPTHFSIVADTTYVDTEAEGFWLKHAAENILNKLIERNGTLISNTLEPGFINCHDRYWISKGLNIRGFSLAEKPMFMSFDTWWNGANPLLCLGLGYTKIGPTEYIEIEARDDFYDPVPVLNLDFVNNIQVEYDKDSIFKSIEIGFEKWSAESASGIDDPQSKRVYATKFKAVGKDEKILSKFIGASLAIEQTRRNQKEQNTDWRLDEDTLIIAMGDTLSPPYYTPELTENYSAVTGLFNPETRYNIRLSVARILTRWKKWLQGCLRWEVQSFQFSSGEGNYSMSSTLKVTDCEGDGVALSEQQDIVAGSDFYTMPIFYKFTHPLSWEDYKLIRDNRKKAVGISRTDSGHVACHIESLEYVISEGKATFTVKPGTFNLL